ncbi:unnamed protein product [Phytomonas sp. EM1]|nr:unnamed protein product [Phytomonas sp. EM1]|eukprot:CCW60792.1 unnamed protein product [Phytomonas sp. isolate EM1]
MEFEIKVLLADTSDYQILTKALAPLFVKEETYCDYFFDFENEALTQTDSVVRLRVPIQKPNPSTLPIWCGGNVFRNKQENEGERFVPTPDTVTGDSCYEHFLSSCRGPNPIRQQMQIQEQQRAAACGVGSVDAEVASASSVNDPHNDLSPLAALGLSLDPADENTMNLVEGACGRLVFKQNNKVTDGCQLNFIQEDNNVPPDVVKDLLLQGRNNGHATSLFRVLERYAEQRQHEFMQQDSIQQQGSSGSDQNKAPILQILERLRYISNQIRKCAPLQVEAGSEDDGGNFYYSQVRHAAGTHLQLSTLAETQASNFPPYELINMGHYISTRRTYRYLRGIFSTESDSDSNDLLLGKVASTCTSTCTKEQSWRDNLKIRIDKTFYPFGEKYELEVSQIDGPLEDEILAEIKALLIKLQVKYYLGSEGKYARFIREMRNEYVQSQNVQDVKLRLSSFSSYEEVRNNLNEIMMSVQGDSAADPNENCRIEGSRKRQRKCHELLPNAMAPINEHTCELTASDLTEFQENYFFDGPNRELHQQKCFLRLRCYNHTAYYTLVLKENQSFKDGQQISRTSKVKPSADVARMLIQNPTQFLLAEREHNAIARRLWGYFGLRSLCDTVRFTTTRVTVPWLSAQSQRASPMHGVDASALGRCLSQGSVSSQSMPASTRIDFTLRPTAHAVHPFVGVPGSRQCDEEANVVEPLQIHLDRTQYLLPSRLKEGPQQSFGPPLRTQVTFNHPSIVDKQSDECCELYEIEVTNIMPYTSPSAVMEELTHILDGIGVEWRPGIQSKLDQYYTLLSMKGDFPTFSQE